jgi:hypothetical protein
MKMSDLKSIIREVVRHEIREALHEVMSNTSKPQPVIAQKPIQKPLKKTGNSLHDILNETAASNEWRTLNGGPFTANHAPMFNGGMQNFQEPQTTSVQGFLKNNSNPHAQDIRQVQINDVPDFSAMMTTMKSKGLL